MVMYDVILKNNAELCSRSLLTSTVLEAFNACVFALIFMFVSYRVDNLGRKVNVNMLDL